MATFLRKHGYRLLVAADVEDAFEWITGVPSIHVDLLLINLLGKTPEEALTVGRRLRERSIYDGNTPIVILPESIPAKLQGTDETLNNREWVCYYEDVNQLARLLASILEKPVNLPTAEGEK